MHINKSNLGCKLNNIELLHLSRCNECKFEHELLLDLKRSADEIELMTPPENDWELIKRRINKPPVLRKSFSTRIFIGIAASFFVTSVCWLMWSNFKLQNQLDHMLYVNQSLEIQLRQVNYPNEQQVLLLDRVKQLEYRLDYTSSSEKIKILADREILIKKLLESQKKENVISI